MEVRELRDALAAFNQSGTVAISIPSAQAPHEVRAIRVVGHLDHPGEVKNDDDHPGALDILCDGWDTPAPSSIGRAQTVADIVTMLEPYPEHMHVRVAVPISHDTISHRMLDIVMLGHSVGTGQGAGIQIITESWDFPHMVIREYPEVVAARRAEHERLAASVPPGEALPD